MKNDLCKESQAYFLFFGRAVDPTMLTALSATATEQADPTEETMKKVKHLLDYCALQEDAVIMFRASKMILAGHSNAGYLNEKKHEAEQGGISICPTTSQCHQITEQF